MTAPKPPPSRKYVRLLVWHTVPTWPTPMSGTPPSQPEDTGFTYWTRSEVSPLRQYSLREHGQNMTLPELGVRSSASSSVQPSINTSWTPYYWITAATSSSGSLSKRWAICGSRVMYSSSTLDEFLRQKLRLTGDEHLDHVRDHCAENQPGPRGHVSMNSHGARNGVLDRSKAHGEGRKDKTADSCLNVHRPGHCIQNRHGFHIPEADSPREPRRQS